ncbi:MAG: potassium-transporting ATPase subunit KdpC [Pyrinomonadaceae bacterium]
MKDLITSVLMLVLMTVVLGLGYPFVVWGIAQVALPHQANGSLIERDGKLVGSELIGQNFTSDKYFHGRLSAAGSGYDASASGGSNLGPTSAKLIERVKVDAAGVIGRSIPADLVTTSASGLDAHISPASAEYQLSRVAAARGVSLDQIRGLIAEFTEGRTFGILGESRVNVLKLNLALDSRFSLS